MCGSDRLVTIGLLKVAVAAVLAESAASTFRPIGSSESATTTSTSSTHSRFRTRFLRIA